MYSMMICFSPKAFSFSKPFFAAVALATLLAVAAEPAEPGNDGASFDSAEVSTLRLVPKGSEPLKQPGSLDKVKSPQAPDRHEAVSEEPQTAKAQTASAILPQQPFRAAR